MQVRGAVCSGQGAKHSRHTRVYFYTWVTLRALHQGHLCSEVTPVHGLPPPGPMLSSPPPQPLPLACQDCSIQTQTPYEGNSRPRDSQTNLQPHQFPTRRDNAGNASVLLPMNTRWHYNLRIEPGFGIQLKPCLKPLQITFPALT